MADCIRIVERRSSWARGNAGRHPGSGSECGHSQWRKFSTRTQECLIVRWSLTYFYADSDPSLAARIAYEVAYTSPFTYLAKPVTVLVCDGFDQQPYLKLRIKAYVFDHRYAHAERFQDGPKRSSWRSAC